MYVPPSRALNSPARLYHLGPELTLQHRLHMSCPQVRPAGMRQPTQSLQCTHPSRALNSPACLYHLGPELTLQHRLHMSCPQLRPAGMRQPTQSLQCWRALEKALWGFRSSLFCLFLDSCGLSPSSWGRFGCCSFASSSLKGSVADPRHFGVDPDPDTDPRVHASD
jgi:hypothetical protein